MVGDNELDIARIDDGAVERLVMIAVEECGCR